MVSGKGTEGKEGVRLRISFFAGGLRWRLGGRGRLEKKGSVSKGGTVTEVWAASTCLPVDLKRFIMVKGPWQTAKTESRRLVTELGIKYSLDAGRRERSLETSMLWTRVLICE